MTHQIGHKYEAALQYSDKKRIFPLEILRDLLTEGFDLVSDLFLGEKHSFNIVFHIFTHFDNCPPYNQFYLS